MIVIGIATDNDAFGSTNEDKSWELARILRDFATKLVNDPDAITNYANLKDINGNTVGNVEEIDA